jgi:hypothetical protein
MPTFSAVPSIADVAYVEGSYWGAEDMGFVAQTLSPPVVTATGPTHTSGVAYYYAFRPATAGPVSKFFTSVQAANVTPTTGQNLLGIYSLNATTGVMTLVCQSVDLSGSSTLHNTTGKITAGIVGPAAATPAALDTTQPTPVNTAYASGGTNYINLVPEALYYIGFLQVAATPAKLYANVAGQSVILQGNTGTITSSVAQSPFVPYFSSGSSLTALASTLNLGTATITTTGTQVPYLAIY